MDDEEKGLVLSFSSVRPLAYADDVQERCYVIWSTSAAMNAEATVARYAQEVGDEVPIPHVTTVRRWVHEQGWQARLVDDFKRNHGTRLWDEQQRQLVRFEAAGEEVSKVLAGLYDENANAGALRLKARELIARECERLPAFREIVPQVPQQVQDDFSKLTLAEREAAMKAAVQAKKGRSHG